MDLQKLADKLFDGGMVAIFVGGDPNDDAAPGDSVRVQLQAAGFDEPLMLTVSQADVDAEAHEGFELLQLYAPVPVEFAAAETPALLDAAARANEFAPLIGFNVHAAGPYLYLRSVVLAPPGDAGVALLSEAVWLAAFTLDLHAANLVQMVRPQPPPG